MKIPACYPSLDLKIGIEWKYFHFFFPLALMLWCWVGHVDEKNSNQYQWKHRMISSAGMSWFCPWGEAWYIIASQDTTMDCLSKSNFSLSKRWRKWFVTWRAGRLIFLKKCSPTPCSYLFVPSRCLLRHLSLWCRNCFAQNSTFALCIDISPAPGWGFPVRCNIH